MSCPMNCPQKRGYGQGAGCACSARATRAAWARIGAWFLRRAEHIALFLILAFWTYLTASGAA